MVHQPPPAADSSLPAMSPPVSSSARKAGMTNTRRSADAAVPLPPLTVEEACALARVCRRTVGRWVDERRFDSWRPIARGSGRRLIDRAGFLRFLGRSDEAAA